jgi:hypothetical protein
VKSDARGLDKHLNAAGRCLEEISFLKKCPIQMQFKMHLLLLEIIHIFP